MEFSKSLSADCRIYANEGVVQLLFFEGDPCNVSYDRRQGEYQDRSEIVTLPRLRSFSDRCRTFRIWLKIIAPAI